MDTGVVWIENIACYGPTINIGFRSDLQFLPGGSLIFLEKKDIAKIVDHHTSSNSDVSGAFEMVYNRLNPRIFNDQLEFVEFVWQKMGNSIGHDWHPSALNEFVMYKGFLIRVWYVR